MTLGTLCLGALLALAQAPVLPDHDGWVTDRAGLLEAREERALEDLCAAYRAGSGQEIAVLIVPDLGGRPIEELAHDTARAWKIGDRETSSGALLVVARDEHELRIEVGRGLEGALPDSLAGRIIRDVIVPEFRAGRFYSGLERGLRAIHGALGGDYGALPEPASGKPFEAIPALFVLAFFVFLAARRARTARRHGGLGSGSSALPWLIAAQLGRHGSGLGGRGGSFGGGRGGGFGGFGGGGGFSGGGASGRW